MTERFDIVVVGAGSAGCVLAGRLSQDPSCRVLLVEAGPDGSSAAIDGDSFFDALAADGRTAPDLMAESAAGAHWFRYPVGRGIGGSSAVNAMLATWGMPADYDRWERDLGCGGWSWADVAPIFAQLAIPVTQPTEAELGAVDRALIEAASAIGHPLATGGIGGTLGVGPAWLTRSGGRRVSAADAYLTPARTRPNLVVRADTAVERIVFDATKAVGIELVGGEIVDAGEVVVSAGAIYSPWLLLRSGVDRPGVGQGLKDHASATLTLRLAEPAAVDRLAAASLLRWSSNAGDGDLQLLPLDHVGVPDYGALVAGLMSVHSTGSVSVGTFGPLVRFDMLDDERDRDRLRQAVRHAVHIATSAPFRNIATDVLIDDIGTSVDALGESDAELDAWMRRNVGDYVHASCTCRMGARDDPAAVVDTAGRVHGYTGLRVCDASIFPDIPSANLHLPTVMVAERIAAAITASR